MYNRYLLFYLLISLVFYLLTGCSNEAKTEIAPKKEVSSEEKEKSIVPLPTPQRLRLLPVDMSAQDNSQTNSLVTSSPEGITTRKEDQQTNIPQTRQENISTSPPSAGGFGSLKLMWSVPEGWKEDTTKPMRIISFQGVDNSVWECYISVLISQAGGVEANLKRWAKQMGKRDLNAQDIEQLTDVVILGKQCKLLDITGNYEDMQGVTHENYRLLGAVCSLENQTLFVKMTGPEQEVALQRDNFIKLCNSLTLKN